MTYDLAGCANDRSEPPLDRDQSPEPGSDAPAPGTNRCSGGGVEPNTARSRRRCRRRNYGKDQPHHDLVLLAQLIALLWSGDRDYARTLEVDLCSFPGLLLDAEPGLPIDIPGNQGEDRTLLVDDVLIEEITQSGECHSQPACGLRLPGAQSGGRVGRLVQYRLELRMVVHEFTEVDLVARNTAQHRPEKSSSFR